MNPDQWRRAREILDEALERHPSERPAFLAAACGDNAELLAEVASLVRAHERATAEEAFARSPVSLRSLLPDPAPEASMVGRRIGRYRVVRELGRGGMGAVYLGERDDGQFKRQVAIKMVLPGLPREDVLRRFRRERQILASLRHPHIAQLIDGDVTEDGLPFLVVEYVDGLPIDEYCDAHRLSLQERLTLFRTVCAAVHHAHQNLVVHRDLKPSNIFVDAEGTVKLLDFGIAKLLDPEATEMEALTRTGMRVMTPEYASPEQIRGEPITTAGDVYALGMVLYELLTGRRAYYLGNLTPGAMERQICDEEPARPSTAITRDAGATERAYPDAEAISASRKTLPDRLRRQLRGDLDNIVMAALRKEPERRYGSAEQLSEDIRRHLEGLPVMARADTFSYRAGKFVRRHRVGVAAASLVALLLVVIASMAVWFAYTTSLQALELAAERDRAEAETQKAEQINTFLQEMLSSADPYKEGEEITVAQAMSQAARRIDTELAGHPDVAADLWRTLGVTRMNLGDYDTSEVYLRRALDIRRAYFGAQHPDVAQSLKDLALTLHWKDQLQAADSLYRMSILMHRVLKGKPDPAFAEALNDYGTLLLENGNYREGIAYFEEAIAIYKATTGTEHRDFSSAISNLAQAKSYVGEGDESEPLYRQALDIMLRIEGEHDPDVAILMNNLAFAAMESGNMASADSLFRQSLQLRREIFGSEHALVAAALFNLGRFLEGRKQFAEAERHLRESIEIYRKTLPPDHQYIARSAAALGRVYTESNRPKRGEPLLREALQIYRAALPDTSWYIAETEGGLGACLSAQRRYKEAEPLLLRYYEAAVPYKEEDPVIYRKVLHDLVHLYENWGRAGQSARYRSLLQEVRAVS